MEFEKAEYHNGEVRKRRGRPSKFNVRLAEKIFFVAEKFFEKGCIFLKRLK